MKDFGIPNHNRSDEMLDIYIIYMYHNGYVAQWLCHGFMYTYVAQWLCHGFKYTYVTQWLEHLTAWSPEGYRYLYTYCM